MMNPRLSIQYSVRLAALACVWGLASREFAVGQLPLPELHVLSRQAVQVGASVELAPTGIRLDEAVQLIITDFSGQPVPATIAPRRMPPLPLQEDEETTGSFDVTIDQSAAAGLVEVRSLGRFGISNPRSILLSQRPVQLLAAGHDSPATAVSLPVATLINHHTFPRAANYYRCQLPPGHRLRCVAYSGQVDSQALLNMRLLDNGGRTLASSRAIQWWPAELEWHNAGAEAIDVVVEVRDELYRGGAGFGYLLEAQTDGQADGEASPPLYLDTLLRPSLEAPLKAERFWQASGIAFLHSSGIDWDQLPSHVVEQFPIRVRGDLSQPREVQLVATQGQQLAFDIASSKLDQLTDPALMIFKKSDGDEGQTAPPLVEQDDAGYVGTPELRIRQTDPHLVWTAPESATYRVRIVDRQSGHRPHDALGFLMEIRPPQPSFELMAYPVFPTNNPAGARPAGSALQRDGAVQIHVTILRRDGWDGPIELQAEGLPNHCQCDPVIVPSGASEADLSVRGAQELPSGMWVISIVGHAQQGEETLIRRAVASTVMTAASPIFNAVISRRTDALRLVANQVDQAPLSIQAGDGSVLEVPVGGKVALPVKLIRQTGAAAECTLRPQSMPPNITLGEFKIAADQSEASPELTVAGNAAVGQYTLWLQAETKVKWSANPQAVARKESHLARLQQALQSDTSTAEVRQQLESAVSTLTAKIEELKKQAAEQEYTYWPPSNAVRIRVVATTNP
ncbi:MAG: hypothetical protein KF752_04715 [Pirellulaceae bacterium]|nr:hypothetical protein [Pirellulaceae bacterium]